MKMLSAAAAAALFAVGGLATAKADPDLVGSPYLQSAQAGIYAWGGHQYCWYYDAWHGPGWYWCGYPHRAGVGWGGVWGWNSWVGPGGAGWWSWGAGHGYHDWRGPGHYGPGYHDHGYHDHGRHDHGYHDGYHDGGHHHGDDHHHH